MPFASFRMAAIITRILDTRDAEHFRDNRGPFRTTLFSFINILDTS